MELMTSLSRMHLPVLEMWLRVSLAYCILFEVTNEAICIEHGLS